MAVAKNITVLASGHNLATALTSFVPSADSDELDATVLASDGGFRQYVQSFKSAELALTGIFDSDTANLDKIHDILSAAYNSGDVLIVTASLGAIALGEPALMMDGVQMNYAVPVNVGELIFSNATLKSQNGLNFGKWLMSEAIEEGSVNGSSIDNGAASANGGVFHAHWHNDDATGIRIILQDSANNAAWSAIAEIAAGMKAAGAYTFDANPSDTDTIEFNGVVFTFLDTPIDPDTDVEIKATLAETIAELVSKLNASSDPDIEVASYEATPTQILITFDEPGDAGNAYTLDTNDANISRSAATLTGGTDADEDEHGAGSVTVPAGTTVRRYLRAVAIVAGGDTVLVSAAFARR